MPTNITGLQSLMSGVRGADALLVTNINNVRYLTGFTGSSGFVLVTKTAGVFVTDFRYKEQAALEVNEGWDVLVTNRRMPKEMRSLVRRLGIGRVLVEGSLSSESREAVSRFVDTRISKPLVEGLRSVKDAAEFALIREATLRAEGAFKDIKHFIRPGSTELQISRRLGEAMLNRGCRRPAFDIIVASGPNSAKPHAGVSDRKLGAGDLVMIDWGGEAGGYYSDMTRTVLIKGGTEIAKKKEIYALVLEANVKGLETVRAGREARLVDAAARNVIKRGGFGEYFGHGLGHGIGREVHEAPRIGSKERTLLSKGMIFTVEPGIYLPGLGGVRIEDMIAVTGVKGGEVLTSLPKKLEII